MIPLIEEMRRRGKGQANLGQGNLSLWRSGGCGRWRVVVERHGDRHQPLAEFPCPAIRLPDKLPLAIPGLSFFEHCKRPQAIESDFTRGLQFRRTTLKILIGCLCCRTTILDAVGSVFDLNAILQVQL
jgi:hypothetical protein